MIEYKQSADAWVPVRIFDSGNNPVAGVLVGTVTATVMKSDNSLTTLSLAGGDWGEPGSGAFTSSGTYRLKIAAADMNLTGPLTYAVATSGNKTYLGVIKVVANEEVDTYTRLGAPAGASVSADIAAVKSDSAAIKAKTDNLPVDPADESNILAAITAAESNIRGVDSQTLTTLAGTGFTGGTDSLKILSDTLDLVKAKTDNLPVDPADESNILAAIAATESAIRGGDSRTLTELAGTGFVSGTDSLKIISDNVDAINVETDPASVADAVWNASISTHTLSGSFGQTLQLLNYDTAAAGSPTTLTLGPSAPAAADFFKNALLVITDGMGAGQARAIISYTGLKVATVDRNWDITPDNSSQYMIIPAANVPVDNASIADAVWDEALAGHLTAGSTGAKLNSGATPYAQFYANGDTVAPIIVQVTSPKHTQVRITYSEAVVMDATAIGALNIANYTIPGLTITAAQALTAQQVLLTTSAQTPNQLYTLTVVNVEDLQGNPIA